MQPIQYNLLNMQKIMHFIFIIFVYFLFPYGNTSKFFHCFAKRYAKLLLCISSRNYIQLSMLHFEFVGDICYVTKAYLYVADIIHVIHWHFLAVTKKSLFVIGYIIWILYKWYFHVAKTNIAKSNICIESILKKFAYCYAVFCWFCALIDGHWR